MLASMASAQQARNDARAEWGVTDYLLATLIETVDLSNRLFVMAHATEGTEVPEPISILRPGTETVTTPEPKQATAAEMREFFGGAVTYTP